MFFSCSQENVAFLDVSLADTIVYFIAFLKNWSLHKVICPDETASRQSVIISLYKRQNSKKGDVESLGTNSINTQSICSIEKQTVKEKEPTSFFL